MLVWWWILPAVVGFVGVMLMLHGLGAFLTGRWLSGPLKVILGFVLAWVGAGLALLGFDLQTYGRASDDRPVATVSVAKAAISGPDHGRFNLTLTRPGRDGMIDDVRTYPIQGGNWRIEARQLDWTMRLKPLGLGRQYRLDRLASQPPGDSGHDLTDGGANVEIFGYSLPWKPTIWATAQRLPACISVIATAATTTPYQTLADGKRYDVWATNAGLEIRPSEAPTSSDRQSLRQNPRSEAGHGGGPRSGS